MTPGAAGPESWFEENRGGRAFAFSSGRAALRAILVGGGISTGDEVVLCGYTCRAVVEAVLYAGAVPRYADLGAGSWTTGVAEVKSVATPRTRALVIQHTFGFRADVEALAELGRSSGWTVIEDCALALNSDPSLGTTADAAIFSFEMSKTVTCGWGGIALVRDMQLAESVAREHAATPSAERIRSAYEWAQVLLSTVLHEPGVFDITRYLLVALYRLGVFRVSSRPLSSHAPAGWSRRLSPLLGRVARHQLERLPSITSRQERVVDCYRAWLRSSGRVDTFEGAGGPLVRFPILVDSPETLVAELARKRIEVGRWFDAPVSPMPDDPARVHYTPGSCARSEYVAAKVLNLPTHAGMTDRDIDAILHWLDAFEIRTLPLPN